MGSMITLGIEGLEVDWGKNDFFRNHSALFKREDIVSKPYYYVGHDGEPVVEEKPAYSRRLSDVRDRLDCLGYTPAKCKVRFDSYMSDYYGADDLPHFSFLTLTQILSSVDLSGIRHPGYPDGDYDFGEYVKKCILSKPGFSKYAFLFDMRACEFLERLDPYIILRLLAENPDNLQYDVIWRFFDVVDNGWVREDLVYEQLAGSQKFLLVTEGSSDTFIIRKALDLLLPAVSDLFYFVDMENYPFTGTGNLFKFSQGLMSIAIVNKVLLIYDNDLEGVSKYTKSQSLPLPPNMGIMTLPSLPDFKSFRTLGPTGETMADINGKAVAIECFLDLNQLGQTDPRVRWLHYLEDQGAYQGRLEYKDDHVRAFKAVAAMDDRYDFSKLRVLVKAIVDRCILLT